MKAWMLGIENTRAVSWLRGAAATVDEVLVYAAMLAGVAVSQLVDAAGNRTGVAAIDWLRAGVGAVVAIPHVVLAEQGDRAGKTRALGKMLVRYAHAFTVGFTWVTLVGMVA